MLTFNVKAKKVRGTAIFLYEFRPAICEIPVLLAHIIIDVVIIPAPIAIIIQIISTR